jgi:hypothetical protein
MSVPTFYGFVEAERPVLDVNIVRMNLGNDAVDGREVSSIERRLLTGEAIPLPASPNAMACWYFAHDPRFEEAGGMLRLRA